MADAKRWAKSEEARTEKRLSGYTETNPTTYTIGDCLALWWEHKQKGKRGAETSRYVILALPDFLIRERLASAERDTIQRWVDDMAKTLNPSTVKKRVGMLSASVNFAIAYEAKALGGIPNPCTGLILPALLSTSKRNRIAGAEELAQFHALISKRNEHLGDYITLAVHTACRRGELARLRWGAVDFKKAELHLTEADTKTGEARTVPLTKTAVDVLKQRRVRHPQGSFVFQGKDKSVDKPVDPHSLTTAFRRVREQIEAETGEPLNLRPHDLRHTSATRWAKEYESAFELMAITGHKDIRSLDRYVHPAKAVHKKAKTFAEPPPL
jgi:integrase